MLKKAVLLATLLSLPLLTSATEICPSVDSLQSGAAFKQGWIALNFNDDEPASLQQITLFEHSVTDFYTAEWSPDYTYGYGRCYYHSNADVSVARQGDLPQPLNAGPGLPWQRDSRELYQCSRSLSTCVFG